VRRGRLNPRHRGIADRVPFDGNRSDPATTRQPSGLPETANISLHPPIVIQAHVSFFRHVIELS